MDQDQRRAKFQASLAAHLEPGEIVLAGVLGTAGADYSAIPAVLAISRAVQPEHGGGRMVVVTDRRILLARTGVWRVWRVKGLSATFPLGTPITTKPDGLGRLVEVGGLKVHVGNPKAVDELMHSAPGTN